MPLCCHHSPAAVQSSILPSEDPRKEHEAVACKRDGIAREIREFRCLPDRVAVYLFPSRGMLAGGRLDLHLQECSDETTSVNTDTYYRHCSQCHLMQVTDRVSHRKTLRHHLI